MGDRGLDTRRPDDLASARPGAMGDVVYAADRGVRHEAVRERGRTSLTVKRKSRRMAVAAVLAGATVLPACSSSKSSSSTSPPAPPTTAAPPPPPPPAPPPP